MVMVVAASLFIPLFKMSGSIKRAD
jgi:hypothetical protein